MIKRFFLFLLLGVLSMGASAQIVKGEKSFGLKAGYVSHNESMVAGLVFKYNLNSHLRLAPEIGVAFRHKDEDALLIDLNLEMPLSFSENGTVALYPLVGVAFNSWATHVAVEEIDDDVTSHINRFGANIGAGFDLRCSSSLKLNLEAKYTLVKSYSGVFITAGIAYVF